MELVAADNRQSINDRNIKRLGSLEATRIANRLSLIIFPPERSGGSVTVVTLCRSDWSVGKVNYKI